MTKKPEAGITVPVGKRYFFGVLGSSVKNHPEISTGAAVGLKSSTVSSLGGTVFAITSLITTPGIAGRAPSAFPGEPLRVLLILQFDLLSQPVKGAFSFTTVSENPSPSVIGNH